MCDAKDTAQNRKRALAVSIGSSSTVIMTIIISSSSSALFSRLFRRHQKRALIWRCRAAAASGAQGQDYLCKIGPDLAFLHDVYSLGTRLPRTAPEATDPFLATVTPSGVPIEEPSHTRLGSSRKGGEGARIAAARKVMTSLRGQMPWEKEQEHLEMLASLPGSGSRSRPHPGGRHQSPRTNGVKLAPLPGTSGMKMSPKPPGSAERFESPDDEINESTMPPLPGDPFAAASADDFSQQMVANSFASLGWPGSFMAQAAAPEEGAAADAFGFQQSESAPVDPADVQEPDAADPGEEEQPGAPDDASATPGDAQMDAPEEKLAEVDSAVAAAGKNDEVDPVAGEGDGNPVDSPAAPEVEKESVEAAAEAESDLVDAAGAAPEVSVAKAEDPSMQEAAETSVAQGAAEVAPEPVAVDLQPVGQFVRAMLHVTEDDEEVEAQLEQEEAEAAVEEGDEEEELEEEEEAVKVCFDFGRTSSYIDYIQRTSTAKSNTITSLLNAESSTGFLFGSTPVKVEISVSEPEKPVTLELLCQDQGPAGDAAQLPSVTAEIAVAEDAERPVTLALRCAEEPASGPQGAPVAAKLVVNEADKPVTLQLKCTEELSFTGSFVFPAPSAESSEQLPTLEGNNREPEEPSTSKARFPPPALDTEAPPVIVSLQVIATPKTSRTPKTTRTPSKSFATPKSAKSTGRSGHRPVRLELLIAGLSAGDPAVGSTPTPAVQGAAEALPDKTLSPSSGQISLSLSVADDSDKPVTVTLKPLETPESQGVPAPGAAGPVSLSLSIAEGSENPVTITLKSPETTGSQGMPAPEAAGPVELGLSVAEDSETPVTVTLNVPETTGSRARAVPEAAAGPVALRLSIAEGSDNPVTVTLAPLATTASQAVAAQEAAGSVALSLSIAEGSENPVTATLKSTEAFIDDRAMAAPEPAGDGASSAYIPEDSKKPVTVTSESPKSTEGQGKAVPAAHVALSLSITEGAERPVVATLEISAENSGDGTEMGNHETVSGVENVAADEAAEDPEQNNVDIEAVSAPAIESANRLLDASCADEDLPLVARISVLHGIAMLRENETEAAARSFDESLGLHTAWAGPESLVVQVVSLFKSAASLVADSSGLAAAEAEGVVADAQAQHGPDSLAVGQAAQQLGWLLLMNEKLEEAEKFTKMASRILRAWHGPKSSQVAVCGLLLDVIIAKGLLAAAAIRQPVDAVENADGAGNVNGITMERAVEQASLLLQEALHAEGGDEDEVPAIAHTALLEGAARLVGGAKEDSERLLAQSSELIESWLGPRSPGIQVVRLIQGGGTLMFAGEWSSGYSPAAAEAALAEAAARDGPESRGVADAAAQASWLLHLSGHCDAAGDVVALARRLQRAWHGPKSAESKAADALAKVVAA